MYYVCMRLFISLLRDANNYCNRLLLCCYCQPLVPFRGDTSKEPYSQKQLNLPNIAAALRKRASFFCHT